MARVLVRVVVIHEQPEESGIWQGGALNLSQALPAPGLGPPKTHRFWGGLLQLNLNKLSDAGGSQIQWLSDAARNRFFRLFVYIILLMSIGVKLYADSSKINDCGQPHQLQTQEKMIDVFANALYWHTSETIDWAHILTSSPNFVQDAYRTISFDWDPGFRIGFGYHMYHDQWDTQFAYTWFRTQATDHGTGPITSGFLAARLSLLEPFHTGKMRLNLNYNIFDWDLGRNCWVSESLSLRPFIGVKAGWIDQTIHIKWTTPNFIVPGFLYSASEKVENNFQGGGPKGGVNGKWILGNVNRHVFSLIGDFAGAFMWGRWKLEDQFIDVFLTQTSIPMGNRNFGALMVQALMGFGWDYRFESNCSHFAMKVGYEIQDWFNHFQVFTNDSGTDNLDLILQGLTLDLRFDF